jgi:DMSO/TMAO reductase YedYZ molybdopterin-dependent catalytic subunit
LRLFLVSLLAAILCSAAPAAAQSAPSAAPAPALSISGDIPKPLTFSLADFRALPHTTLKVTNPHTKKEEVYEGVPLVDLLKLAGAPQGENLRGAAMSTVVMVEAADGYRVAFSLAELDASIQDSGVILADKLDGHSLDDKLGPLRLVAPHDLRPARWVRMVRAIRIVSAPK